MADRIDYPLTVYFDGACSLCRRQILSLSGQDTHQRLQFQDITDSRFHAEDHGLDISALQKTLHVQDRQRRVACGVDAFVWIWWAIGKRRQAVIFRFPGVNFVARQMYKIVARWRYWISGWRGEKVCRGKCGWRHY